MPRISLYHSIESAPLAAGFQQTENGDIQLSTDPQDRGEFLFADQEFDGALVSPLVYGKDAGDMCLVPACAVTSTEGTNLVRLVFRAGLRSLSAISVPRHHALERMLTQIVLAEKYDMRPVLMERKLPAEESFAPDIDAILLAGDEAATAFRDSVTSMDMVEEWIDMTELPFVHAVWAMWNSRADARIVERIQRATVQGTGKLDAVLLSEEKRLAIPADEISARYAHLDYSLDEEKLDALSGFFRMAFFHGHREDVPDLNLWEG